MKQSVINSAFRAATACFARHGWTLPPKPKWDITDFGLGEVSTANDDLHDNFFLNPDVGRFPGIEEDEVAAVKLVSQKGGFIPGWNVRFPPVGAQACCAHFRGRDSAGQQSAPTTGEHASPRPRMNPPWVSQ